MAEAKRTQKFVDSRMQGALLLRCAAYWGLCMLMLAAMILCWRVYVGPVQHFQSHLSQMWLQFGPAAIASCFLLPILIADVIRVTNRVCGPMLRIRGAMRQLAAGETVEPVELRDDDFWHDFAEEFNAVIRRVQTDGKQPELPAADNSQRQDKAAAREPAKTVVGSA